MRKSILVLAFLSLLTGCSKNKSTSLLLPDDIIEEVNFEDIACDIQVFSLKSPYLMKGIEMLYGIDDLVFGISEDHRTIYWIKGDSVISVLEKYGRGHGEYTYINDFTYYPQDSILYVHTIDDRLMRFQGLNGKYLGECSEFQGNTGMHAIDSRTLLANGSYDGEDGLTHQGLFLIDAETGKLGKMICPMDYAQGLFNNDETRNYQSGDSIWFIVPGPGDDDNIVYMFLNDSARAMLSFRYDEKWRIPESVLLRELPVSYRNDINFIMQKLQPMMDYRLKESYCNGGYDLIYSKDRMMFWSFAEKPQAILNVIKDKKDVSRYLVTLPGFEDYVYPTFMFEDYYVTTFNTPFGIDIADEEQLTPLGKQIKKEIDSSDGNPAFLMYHIKK